MKIKVTGQQIALLRLQTQRLVESDFTSPADAVRGMLAMQAQDFAAAQWAIGVRVPGSTAKDIAAAMESGEIIRSWPMRGTLFFIAPEDLHWMLGLTSERTLKSAARRRTHFNLDDKTLNRARTIAVDSLSGGRRLSREDFMRALQDGGVETGDYRGYHLIWFLAQSGVVCWGPPHKSKQALVLLDEWVPKPRVLERDQALAEFVLRYFRSHGPATFKDFVWWSKLTVADAKVGYNIVRDQLVELECDGVGYFMTDAEYERRDPKSSSAKRSLLLSPAFDEFILGYQERGLVLPKEYAKNVVPGDNGMFAPVVVKGGVSIGTWRRSGTTVTPTYFAGAHATAKDLQHATARLHSFLTTASID